MWKLKNYSRGFVKRLDFISEKARGKRVLNLGCADATRVKYAIESDIHLHYRLSKVAQELVGVDINEQALEILQEYIPNSKFICHNVEKLSELDYLGKFDLIVCGELIEHITNPGIMLEGIKQLLSSEGELIITTPNALSLKFFVFALIFGQEVSADFHTLCFSPKTLSQLLIRSGYREFDMYFSEWVLPYSLKSRLYYAITQPVYWIKPWLADTLIMVARKGK